MLDITRLSPTIGAELHGAALGSLDRVSIQGDGPIGDARRWARCNARGSAVGRKDRPAGLTVVANARAD